MKKLPLLLLCGALLVSCGDGGASSSGEVSSEPMDASKAFFADLAKLKETASYAAAGSFTIVGQSGQEETTSYGTQLQFGHDALLWTDEDSGYPPSGALKNGEQGVFTYTLNKQGNVELGEFVTLDGGLPIEEIYDAPTAFAIPSFWKNTEESTIFRSNNSYMQDVLAGLSGISALASQAQVQFSYGSIYAQYEEDALTFRMEGFLGDTVPVIRGEVIVSDIGTTSNEAVTSYLSSPTLLEDPTAWNEEEKADIARYFGGEKAIDLPFPEGASYTLSVNALEEYEETLIADVACGDLTASYKAQLEKEGFEVNFNESTAGHLAKKEIEEGKTRHIYLVHFLYFSQEDIAASYGQATATLYPKGRFQIEALYQSITIYTLAEANAYLQEHSTFAFPTPEYTGVSDVRLEDLSNVYPLIETAIIFLYQVDTYENAKANLLAYGSTLEAAGFVEQTSANEYSLAYALPSANAKVTLAISLDDNGNYAGSIEAFYMVQKA